MAQNRATPKKRNGFTLVELVIVVLILGIIAAIAAPKMFDTAANAREAATRQSLAVIRDAIELYRAQNGIYPLAATVVTALRPYINGPFPAAQVGNINSNVDDSNDDPLTVETSGDG